MRNGLSRVGGVRGDTVDQGTAVSRGIAHELLEVIDGIIGIVGAAMASVKALPAEAKGPRPAMSAAMSAVARRFLKG